MGAIIRVLRPQPAQVLHVWYRHVLSYMRFYKTSILLNFFEPITTLVALGFGIGALIHHVNGTSYLAFIAPGLVCVTAMNSVSFDTLFGTYNFMFDNKVYPSMVTAPLEIDDIVCGALAWEATRAIIYGGTFMIVITVMGLVHSFTALLVFPVLALAGIMFAAPAMCTAAAARAFQQMFYYMTLFITPMFMFSGIFFPPKVLPPFAQKIIWFTPLYHFAHVVRMLVFGQLNATEWVDVAWMAVFAFIMLLFPAGLVRRRLLV